MEKYVITGKQRLSGDIEISGAKNSAVAILPATVLIKARYFIDNVPDIADISVIIDILRYLGAEVKITKTGKYRRTLEIDTTGVQSKEIPYEFSRKLRASYYFLGSMLGRFSFAKVAMPGGCNFGGRRPINFHLDGFETLGAKTSVLGSLEIDLKHPSLASTLNAVITAINSNCTTVIRNAFIDEHIKDILRILRSGNKADIEYDEDSKVITVDGCVPDCEEFNFASEIIFDEQSKNLTTDHILTSLHSNSATVIKNASTDERTEKLVSLLNEMGENITICPDNSVIIPPIKRNDHYSVVSVKADELIGNTFTFTTVSVGATINIMLAAVLADGTTTINNAAREPHIVDLANFLNRMGASIRGAGTDTIKIYGKPELQYVEGKVITHEVIPDQIEAGTYMVAAAATGGDITITNVVPQHLDTITDRLRACGCTVEEGGDSVRVISEGRLKACNLRTKPYPGFPTDMQPQFTTLLTICEGKSDITDAIWGNRFKYTQQLQKMGADISVESSNTSASVDGVETLHGANVSADDLRAGAAMIIAGLCAEGETAISNIHYIDRGYESIVDKLTSVGAKIERRSFPDTAEAPCCG